MENRMSQKSFVEFYETYLPGPKGADALSKLKATKDEKEYVSAAVQAGKAAGYDFSPDDVLSVMKGSEAKKKQASGELSDAQLAGAVGGAALPEAGMTVNIGSLAVRQLSPSIGKIDPGAIGNTVMCPW